MAILGTLLPNGKQQFFDSNGSPLVGGSVYFYIPSTSTLKNTWQDPGETILNTNPVVLDSLGSAVIYGTGQYRQVVKDAGGNTLWDQLTNDTLPTTLASFSGALVYLNANISVSDGVDYAIVWDSVSYDTSSFWSAGAPTRLTIPSGVSKVMLNTTMAWDGTSALGMRKFNINKNGSGLYAGRAAGVVPAFALSPQQFSLGGSTSIINVSQGDYFEVSVQQSTGGSYNLIGSQRTSFSIQVIA